jgi:cytochrome c biogenesis protein CcmG, thiol:disulfide interchange protein DsbE
MGCARVRPVRYLAIGLILLAVAGCDSDDDPAPAAGPAGEQARFLDGGREAFEAYVADQRGKPVVVNKWASWCGPCRFEFPFFQSQAKKRGAELVFVGVNSNDNRGNAEEFLRKFPVPFPHFEDPESEVAASFNAVQAFPATAFYDSKGELAFVHQGGYASEAKLAEDIDRYAR